MEETYRKITRIEKYLAVIIGEDAELPECPIYREEFYLAKIAGETVPTLPTPIARIDFYLAKIAGESVDLPFPITRIDRFLAKIAGMDVETPTYPLSEAEKYLLVWAEGGGYETITVTGESPLLLANAMARQLVSLTQTGVIEQDTPSPATPAYPVCNNGVVKMVDDELPDGYRRVLGYNCNNNAMWEITGFHLKGSDTVRISFSIDAACNVFGCYQGADANDNYDLYASVSSGAKYFRYGNGTYLSYWSNANLGERFDVVYTPTGSHGMPQDSTWTAMTFTSANDFLVGSTTLTGSSSKLKGKLYGNIVVDGRLKLIPCERISDGVLGYYDTYSEAFYEPYTGYDGAVSLGYDGSHYVRRTVGTPESIRVGGKNLNSGTVENKGYTSTGGESSSTTFAGTLCKIPTQQGEKFVVSWDGFPDGVSGVFVNTWKTDGTWNTRQAISASTSLSYTIGAGIGMVNFTLYKTGGIAIGDNAWIQVERGTTPTAHEAYREPTYATAVDLFACGSYADEQEIVAGAVGRAVGIKILDGTETIGTSNACYTIGIPDRISSKVAVICSHFPYSTKTSSQVEDEKIITFSSTNIGFRYDACASKTAFGDWLKAQYEQGTPVIVVYPLAEETTESVTPQPITLADGDNVVSVLANVSNIPLEAVYDKHAS